MTVHEVDEATPCSDGTKYRSVNGLVISGQKRTGERVSCERLRETVEKSKPKKKLDKPGCTPLPRENMIQISRLFVSDSSGSVHRLEINDKVDANVSCVVKDRRGNHCKSSRMSRKSSFEVSNFKADYLGNQLVSDDQSPMDSH